MLLPIGTSACAPRSLRPPRPLTVASAQKCENNHQRKQREMMMMLRTAFVVVAFAVPLAAGADVFRCTDRAGKVEYSDSPCVSGVGRQVAVDQNVFSGPGGREQFLRDENQRLRNELESAKSQIESPSQRFGRTEADLQAEKGGTFECTRARRNYEVSASSNQWNRSIEADELAMYSACGMRPPDKIINVTNVNGRGPHRTARVTNCDRQRCPDDLGNRTRFRPSGPRAGPSVPVELH